MPTDALRTTNVLITWNNPDPNDVIVFKNRLDAGIQDLVHSLWCQEHWQNHPTGTPHMHGFLLFSERKTWNNAFRESLGLQHASILLARGSHQQATDYIRKIGVYSKHHTDPAKRGKPHTPHNPDWDEKIIDDLGYGTLPESGQGARNDLKKVTDALQSGSSAQDIARDPEMGGTYIRYSTGVERSFFHQQEPRCLDQVPRVLVAYGTTGSFKTRLCLTTLTTNAIPYYIRDPGQKEWFDGYASQKAIHMEEFRGHTLPYSTLLHLLDWTQYRAPVKSSFVQVQADTFTFATPVHPKDWYSNLSTQAEGSLDQLKRRLSENPQSRILNMDSQCFVDWDGNQLPFTATPDWLKDSITKIIPTFSHCSSSN